MYPMSCHPYIFSRPRPKPSFAPARPARSARAPVPNVPSARAPENGPVHASTRRMAWPWSKMGKNGDLLVERCGKMWKVKFIGSETFFQKLGDVGKASWKMVQSGCTEKLYHPHFSWLSRHATGGSNLKPCNNHFVVSKRLWVKHVAW